MSSCFLRCFRFIGDFLNKEKKSNDMRPPPGEYDFASSVIFFVLWDI